jgi:tripartite-type tricarboxylate transporter receptor subunit TctC
LGRDSGSRLARQGAEFKVFSRRLSFSTVPALLIAVAALSAPSQASAQSMADTFHGKTLKILVPSAPGGDRALYPTILASYLSKHIPGNPTVLPVFMPGAGGSVALNYAYNVAAPDGLTIVTPLVAVVTAQAVGDDSVKYDVRKFNWIGRIADATRVLLMSNKVGAKTMADLRGREVVIGAVGRASETYLMPAFMNKIFGTKFKIVTGYQAAGKMNLAIESGETQASITTWNDIRNYHMDWIRDGGPMRLIVQIALAKHPDLPNLPLLLDSAQNQADHELIAFMSASSQMGQSYAAPPGVPAPILEALRRAFDATMKDPAYQDRMRTGKVEFNPITGEELTKIVLGTIGTPKSVIDRYKAAVAGN